MTCAPVLSRSDVRGFLDELFGDDVHAKRVLSLSDGVLGVLNAGALSVHAIGQGLAVATGGTAKHTVKQVDRLLSNVALGPHALSRAWVAFVLGERKEVVVALDWTDFDGDEHTTLALHVVTRHGRATPLLWKTVLKATLAARRNEHEDRLLERLREVVAADVRVTVLGDRGFGDQKLYAFLHELGFDYVIRFRACIEVEDARGRSQAAARWVPLNGRVKTLPGAKVTADKTCVPVVVCTKAKGMKDAWCLASSRTDLTGAQLVSWYGKRFSIEETFRDVKDLRFGLGLSWTSVASPARRDVLWMLVALSHALLTLLGAAAEQVGFDRLLKVNTVKRRTHSLFRQGWFWYRSIPNLPQERLSVLMMAFGGVVMQHLLFQQIFGTI